MKKRMKKAATLFLAGITALSAMGEQEVLFSQMKQIMM